MRYAKYIFFFFFLVFDRGVEIAVNLYSSSSNEIASYNVYTAVSSAAPASEKGEQFSSR